MPSLTALPLQQQPQYSKNDCLFNIPIRQGSPCSLSSQDGGALDGPGGVLAQVPCDETPSTRLHVDNADRIVRTAAGSACHRCVPRLRTDTPLSGGSGRIPKDEPRRSSAGGFDRGNGGEGGSGSLELVVAEVEKAESAEKDGEGNDGRVGAGTALAAGVAAALFGAALSFFDDAATAAREGRVFGVNDGNDHGAGVDKIFDVRNPDGHPPGEVGTDVRGRRVEVSELRDRAPTAAPAPAPSIPPADVIKWPVSEALRRRNDSAQARGLRGLRAVEDEGKMSSADERKVSSAGADARAWKRETDRLVYTDGRAILSGSRVLQVIWAGCLSPVQ